MSTKPCTISIVYKGKTFSEAVAHKEEGVAAADIKARLYALDARVAILLALTFLAVISKAGERWGPMLAVLWLLLWVISLNCTDRLWLQPIRAGRLSRLWRLESERQQYMIDNEAS